MTRMVTQQGLISDANVLIDYATALGIQSKNRYIKDETVQRLRKKLGLK